MAPSEIVALHLPLGFMNHTFKPGHRIRLVVTSSWFSYYWRNLNGAENPADQNECHIAQNRVYHSAERPSKLLLPIERAAGSQEATT